MNNRRVGIMVYKKKTPLKKDCFGYCRLIENDINSSVVKN